MKRFVTVLSLLTLMALLLTGCGSQAEGGTSGGGDDGKDWLLAQVTFYNLDDSIDLQITYRYNSHGDICRNTQYSGPDQEWTSSFEYTYLEDGRVSKIYRPEGKYAEVYSWDPTGKIAYISTVYDSGSGYGDDKVAMKAYDDQGRLVEEDTGYGQYYRTYTDTETAVKYYIPSLDETTLTVTKYDEFGRKIEVCRYEADGFTDCTEEHLTDYFLYSYDKKGRCAGHKEYSADGSMTTKAVYAYEADGHSYRITYYDAADNVTEYRTYLYKPAKEVTAQ